MCGERLSSPHWNELPGLFQFFNDLRYTRISYLKEAEVRALDAHKANSDALLIDAVCYLMGFVSEYRCSLPCGDIVALKKSNWSERDM